MVVVLCTLRHTQDHACLRDGGRSQGRGRADADGPKRERKLLEDRLFRREKHTPSTVARGKEKTSL